MFILDKSCEDILCAHWLAHTELGSRLNNNYKSKSITKEEYLDSMYSYVSAWKATLSLKDVEHILTSVEFYDFKLKRQLSKLDNADAACLIEPILVKNIDSEGTTFFCLRTSLQKGDKVLKILPFEPRKFNRFLCELESSKIYNMGLNWQKKVGSPTILIFGKKEACIELKEQLKGYYGINS